jgi:ATP/maltotriose-dependent transcriptional regulator MalT
VGGPYLAGYSMALELERGNVAAAEKQLAAANLPEGPPPTVHVMFLQLTRGRLRLEQRNAEAALRDFRMVGEYRSDLGIDNPATGAWRSGTALDLDALGKRSEALSYAIEEVDLARRWGAPRGLGFALRTLALIEGGSSRTELLEESVDVLEDSGARLELARSLVELGSALRRADSRDLLRRGLELAHRCGASPLEERAHAELAATGARPRRVVLTGLDALTPSERRIAEHAAEGLSNKEIAQTLSSPRRRSRCT